MAIPSAQPNPTANGIISALSNQPTLLMKMQILSLGKNYDVMDPQKQVLCRIGLDGKQNMTGAVVGSLVSQVAGGYVGRYVRRSMSYTYTVKDPEGNVAMLIEKSGGGNTSQFAVRDASQGGTFGVVHMKRSLLGGLKATWVDPDGSTRLHTRGNIIRRKYAMVDSGGREVGRVRHKILAIRDVWQLEFPDGGNHLFPAIFATVLDFEKKM